MVPRLWVGACLLGATWAQDGTCSADGGAGCLNFSMARYPDCEYSCDEMPYIGPDCGNKEKIWPICPGGPDACRDCDDQNPSCPRFAAAYSGYGCEDNPAFMIDVCAKSCNTCHLRDLKKRCAGLVAAPEAIQPGDMNDTFHRILNMPGLETEVLSRDPWIIRFPNFLTEEELHFLLNPELSGARWQEASDTGAIGKDGRAQKKFSSNRKTGVIWCKSKCHDHPTAKAVRARISELTRVHPHYFESFQFLRYLEGQYYKRHHDAAGLESGGRDVSKHRIYTFFLYLNDVEEGGETTFPNLGLTVKPSRGSAILWPSVLNHDPWKTDTRTDHAAEVVVRGIKFSMNIWIHLGPYMLAHNIACSASPID